MNYIITREMCQSGAAWQAQTTRWPGDKVRQQMASSMLVIVYSGIGLSMEMGR